MGLFSRREKREHDPQANAKLADFIRGTDLDESAGVSVTEETALSTTAVYACVKVIAESIASLPLHLIQEKDRQKTRARDHPLYCVLHDLANEETTSLNFREAMFGACFYWVTHTPRLNARRGTSPHCGFFRLGSWKCGGIERLKKLSTATRRTRAG
jgi:hypothetical protein